MGTSSNSASFLAKINGLPAMADRIAVRAVKANAQIAKKNAEDVARKATGGDGVLSNAGALVRDGGRVTGRAGAKLTVSVKQLNPQVATVKAVGPWQLVNNDAKAHFIGPAGMDKGIAGGASGRKTAKARAGRAKAVLTPYGPKRWVYVKKRTGKKIWQAATAESKRDIESGKSTQKLAQDEMKRMFG